MRLIAAFEHAAAAVAAVAAGQVEPGRPRSIKPQSHWGDCGFIAALLYAIAIVAAVAVIATAADQESQ